MIRLKIYDKYFSLIDGYEVSESSREVKFSSLKLDFTDKTISDLPIKYQECQLVDVNAIAPSVGEIIEGSSYEIDYDDRTDFEITSLNGQIIQNGTPTPNNPVPVTVVKGENTINVNSNSYSVSLGNIELWQAGNYKDKLYKDGDTWYLEKNVGKVVLNGSEQGWQEYSFVIGDTRLFYKRIDDAVFGNLAYSSNLVSTHFVGAITENIGVVSLNRQDMFFGMDENTFGDINVFKSWLNNNNVTVYYPLQTPVTTPITDTTLIEQLASVELENGLNTITVTSLNTPLSLDLRYNFNDDYIYTDINKIIFTGYVNNYTLPKMKNKKEYRELEIDLISPLAMATLRTTDAVGTYKLKTLIKEIIQPLIDDGFELKELSVGDNQATVNYLSETVESALNKLSNQYDFWWYIDENKNIYVRSITSLLATTPKLTYDDNNKINGLIDFTPSIDATDYCNTVDFTNVRLYSDSKFLRYTWYDEFTGDETIKYEYYNPIMKRDIILPGEEIEFDIPFVIDTVKRGTKQSVLSDPVNQYLSIAERYVDEYGDGYTYVAFITSDDKGNSYATSNVTISDSYSDENEFVFVRDPFFKNLIVGMKYNGSTNFEVGVINSTTALLWSKIRINDNVEIEKNKGKINKSGIVEKQIDMNEQWKTYDELIEIANAYIQTNEPGVEKIKLKMDIENNLRIGDIIDIDKNSFLTKGKFIITDKKRKYYDNVDSWEYSVSNTNVLENFVDLFREKEQEEETDKQYNLVTGNYTQEGLKESYGVVVQ